MAELHLPPILEIENAQIIFRNFSGTARPPYQALGDRNFTVVLDPEDAKRLKKDGWNVNLKNPGEENEFYALKVSLRFDIKPPTIFQFTQRGKTILPEDLCGLLDNVEFKEVDLIISPSRWKVGPNTGIKAYLKIGYFTIVENRFTAKYEDIAVDER